MRLVSDRFRRVSPERLGEVLEELSAGEMFDVSDPANPVAVRQCRSCRVELRFPFEGGVRPHLLYLLQNVACEGCADAERAAEERAVGVRELERRVKESGIPEALAGAATWDSLLAKGKTADESRRREEAIAAAREWAGHERPRSGLLFYGEPGTGKTRLAATAAMERLRRWPIRWVSVGVLMAQLDGAWSDDERKAALKVLTSAGPVVLDDFDKVSPSPRVLGQLFTALDKREQARATVIATTNLSPAKLTAKLGEVIVSRLLGMCTVLAYPGPDYRLQIGETT